jgi:hypothetical protein
MVDQEYLLARTVLNRATCVELLKQSTLARVVISVRCLPAALPALIALVEDRVVVASAEESVLLAAKRHDVISVQADGLEEDGAIWSVMASGLASRVKEVEGLSQAVQESLALGAALVEVPLTVVVGHRIG